MTILDDLFNGAEGLWNSIQGTADQDQEVVVYAVPINVRSSDLHGLQEFYGTTSEVLPTDKLIKLLLDPGQSGIEKRSPLPEKYRLATVGEFCLRVNVNPLLHAL